SCRKAQTAYREKAAARSLQERAHGPRRRRCAHSAFGALTELRRVSTFLAVILTVIYPLVLWLAEGQVEPRLLAGLLLLAGLARLSGGPLSQAAGWWIGGTMLLVLGA